MLLMVEAGEKRQSWSPSVSSQQCRATLEESMESETRLVFAISSVLSPLLVPRPHIHITKVHMISMCSRSIFNIQRSGRHSIKFVGV